MNFDNMFDTAETFESVSNLIRKFEQEVKAEVNSLHFTILKQT